MGTSSIISSRMSMKNNWRKNISLLLLELFLTCAVAGLFEWQFKVVRRVYDHFILDNRNHYLSCEQLPSKMDVEETVAKHRDVVKQIQDVATGFVGVEIDSGNCEGKADLLIWYGTHEQRIAIEELK